MPNVNRIISPFIQGGNPDTMAIPITGVVGSYVPYAPGDVGASFDSNNKTYTVAILDSGATSANPVGAPAINQVLFWANRAAGIVSNDYRRCPNPSAPANFVAGILRNTPGTPGAGGTLICMLTRGYGITVAAGTCAAGSQVMADSTASVSRVVTTTGVLKSVGVAIAADANSVISCDVDIPTLP